MLEDQVNTGLPSHLTFKTSKDAAFRLLID